MKHTARFRQLASIGVVVAMSVVGLTAATASAAAKPSGTITFAEGASAHPNYIFPVVSCNYFSVANLINSRNDVSSGLLLRPRILGRRAAKAFSR